MTSVAVVAGTRWRKVLPLPTRQMAYKSCSVYTHTRSLTCMCVFMRFKLFANFLLYLLFEFLAFWPFLHSSPVVAQLCHSILQVVAKNCALFSFSLQLWGFCAYAFLAYSFCDIFIIVFVVFFLCTFGLHINKSRKSAQTTKQQSYGHKKYYYEILHAVKLSGVCVWACRI